MEKIFPSIFYCFQTQEYVVTELKDAECFSVGSDASIVGKIMYVVQYFNTETGYVKKQLEFPEVPFKSSKDEFGKISGRRKFYGLDSGNCL